MTDNHFSYKRSTDTAAAITFLDAKHIFIKAHCPWRNCKVERLSRTLQSEWAYRQVFYSNTECADALRPGWITTTIDDAIQHSKADPDQPTATNLLAEYI